MLHLLETARRRSRAAEAPVGTSRDEGFALIVVIWLSGLLALLTLTFAASARVHVRIAENAVNNASAESYAEAGINLGYLQLLASAAREGRGRPSDRTCVMPDGARLTLSISDEAGRVDLNVASEALLTALLRSVGLNETEAQRLADAIIDFRDGDDVSRGSGAERADYEAAGSSSRPKNQPFSLVDELRGVLGMTRETFEALRPFVTVLSGLEGIDPRVAPPGLVARLAQAAQPGSAGESLPRGFGAASTANAFLVRAAVVTDSTAFVREAVATVVPARETAPATPDPGFGVRARRASASPPRLQPKTWEWRLGTITADERRMLSSGTSLPPC